jgi:hypothetical protein
LTRAAKACWPPTRKASALALAGTISCGGIVPPSLGFVRSPLALSGLVLFRRQEYQQFERSASDRSLRP